jgi:hypothetical protein
MLKIRKNYVYNDKNYLCKKNNMIKRLVVVLALIFVNKIGLAQIDSVAVKQNIKNQSDSMFVAFKKQDWDNFASYMHPKVLELAGGKEGFISILKKEMIELKSLQFTELIQVGNIQLVSAKKSMQCVVQYGLNMLLDSTLVSGVSTSIGESFDNGQTWRFIRNNFKNFTEIKAAFPWVDNALTIPREEQKFGISLQEFLKTYKPIYIAKPKSTFVVRRVITTRKKKK